MLILRLVVHAVLLPVQKNLFLRRPRIPKLGGVAGKCYFIFYTYLHWILIIGF